MRERTKVFLREELYERVWNTPMRKLALFGRWLGEASRYLERYLGYPVLSSGPKQRLTYFTSGQVWTFAWFPDGKQLAFAYGNNFSDVVLFFPTQVARAILFLRTPRRGARPCSALRKPS